MDNLFGNYMDNKTLYNNQLSRTANLPQLQPQVQKTIYNVEPGGLYGSRTVQPTTIDKNIGSTVSGADEAVLNLPSNDFNPGTGDIIDELFGAGFSKNVYKQYGGGFWSDLWSGIKNTFANPAGELIGAFTGADWTHNVAAVSKPQPPVQSPQANAYQGIQLLEAAGLQRKYKSLKTKKKNIKKPKKEKKIYM